MFDDERFAEWLRAYKRDLPGFWSEERYKWEAVKTFQDHFDINAEDLRGMLEVSLADCDNLLTTVNRFPAGMLLGFAEAYPDRVRAMLVDLFDESKDMWERIDAFKKEADDYREETKGWNESHGKGYNHYQDENSITTYLWLRYPTKHYIYKYGIARTLWQEFKTERPIKKGAYASNVRNDEATYDDIRERLAADPDVRAILDSLLAENCDHDETLHTLTIDFGHYVWHHLTKGNGIPLAEGDGDAGDIVDVEVQPDDDMAISLEEAEEDVDGAELVLSYPVIKKMILELFASGKILTNMDAIDHVKSSGLMTEEGLAVMAKTRPLYESRVRWAVFDLHKNDGFLDKPDVGHFIINEAGLEECRRLGIITAVYTKKDFLKEVYMSEERYEQLRGVLLNKLNVILQGAPGVGKTFCARRIAWSIMGCADDSRIQMVQFHQSYTYEDFIMGYKPDGEGFALREGVFYRFCKRAEADPANKYFFIIDEINRGNLSKVLGELMMLIEKPYRGVPLTLAYRDEEFSVPENLYIIGMMNTADRSLALIDYALRRRFAFFEMRPGFDSEVFQAYQEGLDSDTLNQLVGQIQLLNSEIRHDPTLGKGFEIGHSHLCGRETCDDEWLREVVDFDILPTLEEYWFDDEDKVDRWTATLRGVFQ